MVNALMFATGNNATGTPLDFYAAMNERAGGFVADMAADKLLALHENWWGPDHDDETRRDCLSVDWPTNGPVWLNPPYAEPEMPCARRKRTGELNCKKKRCTDRGWHTDSYIPGCIDFIKKAAEQRLRGVETWALVAAPAPRTRRLNPTGWSRPAARGARSNPLESQIRQSVESAAKEGATWARRARARRRAASRWGGGSRPSGRRRALQGRRDAAARR